MKDYAELEKRLRANNNLFSRNWDGPQTMRDIAEAADALAVVTYERDAYRREIERLTEAEAVVAHYRSSFQNLRKEVLDLLAPYAERRLLTALSGERIFQLHKRLSRDPRESTE